VAIGLVSSAIHHFTLFGESRLLGQIVLVSVQVCDVLKSLTEPSISRLDVTDPFESGAAR